MLYRNISVSELEEQSSSIRRSLKRVKINDISECFNCSDADVLYAAIYLCLYKISLSDEACICIEGIKAENSNIEGINDIEGLLSYLTGLKTNGQCAEQHFDYGIFDASCCRREYAGSYDMGIYFEIGEEEIVIEYVGDDISELEADAICGIISNILNVIGDDSRILIADIKPMSDEEENEYRKLFDRSKIEYSEQATIVDLFEEQVNSTPDLIAVSDMSVELTYLQFNRMINRVANYLVAHGVVVGDIVAHLMPSDVRCLIVLLGILKSGGAHLPMIESMPNDRINYMIEDSGAKYVITTSEYKNKIDVKDKILYADELLEYEEETNPGVEISLEDIYSCIYTSGTTGRPKGVLNIHRGVVYGVQFDIIRGAGSYGNTMLSTPLSFIMTNLEIYLPLVRGNKIIVVNPELRKDMDAFKDIICENDVEILSCTPSYFDALTQNEDNAKRLCSSLKCIMLGGEKVYVNDNVARIYPESEVKIFDIYGSTEVHLAALREITEEYGWVFYNTQLIVVNREGYMLPPGIKGEIYIAGGGVASKYLNNKEESDKKFAENILGCRRVYKTGDIGVLNGDGDLKVLGRNDFQIKIRGYRIEIKEVEKVVNECPGVEKGVVIAKTDSSNEKYLCAFYTGDADRERVWKFLESKLPDYMIPSYMTHMEELPKLISGKYDMRKLSELEIEKSDMPYVPPQTELQRRLVEIWERVSGTERVGIDDNFFRSGGDSIKAAKMIAEVREQIKADLSLKMFFENPTVRMLERVLCINDIVDIPWVKAEDKEYYPMTSSQMGIYLSYQKDKEKTDYNLSYCIELDGKIDAERLKEAIVHVTRKHEALRTSFHTVDGELVQKIHDEAMVDISIIKTNSLNMSIVKELVHPFRLDEVPLMRVHLIEDMWHMAIILDVYHIIADGYSMQLMMQEICDFYNGKAEEASVYQFRDYSERLRTEAFQKKIEKSRRYWSNALDNSEALRLNLIPDKHTESGNNCAKRYRAAISGELYNNVKQFCSNYGMTEHMFLLGCISVLLGRYANQKEFAIGTPVMGRDDTETQKIMGMFVNTLPLTMNVDDSLTADEYFKYIKNRCIQAFDNQICPLEEIKSEVKHGVGHSMESLFNVLFVLQNNRKASVSFGEQKILNVFTPDEQDAMYDMLIEMDEMEDRIDVCWQYVTDLFYESTVASMYEHLEYIIGMVTESTDIRLCDLDLCTETDVIETEKFNDTEYKYDRTKTVVKLFSEQVTAHTDKIALEASDGSFSYGELDERSNRIANALIESGVQRGAIVPFMLSRSSNMIAVMLGILKSGCAYLPVDTSYPESRILYMLEDCGAEYMITDRINAEKAYKCEKVVLAEDMLENENTALPDVQIDINDLCYCIYTSGSTGRPKGTLLEHRTLCNLITWEKETQEIDLSGRVLAGTTISFDVATQEIMSALLCGGTLILLKDGEKTNINSYCRGICEGKADVIFCTPSYLELISEQNIWLEKICRQLSDIVLAGEAMYLNKRTAEMVKENSVRVHNHYGPTESHVVTAKTYHGDYSAGDISIGCPINNTKIYIMDGFGKPVPTGVSGELCIAGESVGRGYWNRESLTSERFIDNKFGTGRMYRTGDLARWTKDGELQYLGRMDEQLKIRGLRIEPGEIRNVICRQPGVRDAVVIAAESGGKDKYLCAYIVGENKLDFESIRRAVRMELAEYMIPDFMMQIDRIPVNANGKLDRKGLPAITLEEKCSYEEPVGAIEKMICRYFAEVLGLDRVGANDNFFRIGGHSLKAMQAANRIEQASGVRVDLNTFFANPTARELARELETVRTESCRRIPKAEEAHTYPMSSAQKRMYVMYQMNREALTYNLPYFLKTEGELDACRLERAVNEIVRKHSILRTTFHMDDGEPVQRIHDEMYIPLERGISHKEFVRPFCLEDGPLLRVCYSMCGEAGYLMLDMHHIIADGITLKNFITELAGYYNGTAGNEKAVQYCDYSEWLRTFRADEIRKQEQYWLKKFSDEVPVLDIITDYPRPSEQSYRGKTIGGRVPAELSTKIKGFAAENGVTPYMVMLSGVMILLHKYSRQEEIVIGTPVSGRIHKDTENMLGVFVNTLALRGRLTADKSYKDFLQGLKSECTEAYRNQEYPFDELVDNLCNARDTSRNPLFDVVFNMQSEQPPECTLGEAVLSELDMSEFYNIAKFDMTVNVRDMGDEYGINWEYCTDLFVEAAIHRMMGIYIYILERIVSDESMTISDISVCDEKNCDKILNVFNHREEVSLPFETIGEAFEDAVHKNSNKQAVCFGNSRLSYAELNEQVDYNVRMLLANGLKRGDRVVVCMERGIGIIVMQLAVIKAGGVFVPVDNDYPERRIRYTIQDSGAEFVMFDRKSQVDPECSCKVLFYGENESLNDTPENGCDIPVPHIEKDDECYVIYTSGSTGEPKGCRLTHKGILNFCLNNNILETTRQLEQPVGAAVNSVAFDYFIAESLFMLLNGYTVALADRREQVEQMAYRELVRRNKVNMIQTTPTRLGLFMEDKSALDYLKDFKMIVLSGEELKKTLFMELREVTSAKIYNPCGPSEASVWAAGGDIADCENNPDCGIHIGKPICNVQLYIMDGNGHLLPPGVPGELVIGGIGVGLGYINKDELTREKFIKNPYGTGNLYKTGDLALWREDGNIRYLGRIDQQVKIRGLRIEIGEIESVIKRQEGIDNAVVIVKEIGGERQLCAYLVGDADINIRMLRRELEKVLPKYMVPVYMMQIDRIYYNSNGKLDRKQFPEIIVNKINEDSVQVGSEDAGLLNIIGQIIGVDGLSMDDDFFELGGDSIKAIRIVTKFREAGYDIAVRDILSGHTMSDILAAAGEKNTELCCSQDMFTGSVPLSPIINEYLDWNLKYPDYFNQANMIKIRNSEYSDEILMETVNELCRLHDMLRAIFSDGCIEVLPYEKNGNFTVQHYDIGRLSEKSKAFYVNRMCTEVQKTMNLKTGPLVKLCVFRDLQYTHILICVHHLVIDGVSWRILLDDFDYIYGKRLSGESYSGLLKTAQYKEWVEALERFAQTVDVKSQTDYWNMAAKSVETIEPNQDSDLENSFIDTISVWLEDDMTEELLLETQRAYNTEINELLLAALTGAVSDVTGMRRISISMEGHGREELDRPIQTDRTIGWFTNLYPLTLETFDEDISRTIIGTKETLRSVPAKGIGYGILKYMGGGLIEHKRPTLCFNYLGDFDAERGNHSIMERSEYGCGISISKNNRLSNDISINCFIAEGRLNIDISYDKMLYNEGFICGLAETYLEYLERIAEHCRETDRTIYSSSDFGDSELASDELYEILQLFE